MLPLDDFSQRTRSPFLNCFSPNAVDIHVWDLGDTDALNSIELLGNRVAKFLLGKSLLGRP